MLSNGVLRINLILKLFVAYMQLLLLFSLKIFASIGSIV